MLINYKVIIPDDDEDIIINHSVEMDIFDKEKLINYIEIKHYLDYCNHSIDYEIVEKI